jgi:hypothetical protein
MTISLEGGSPVDLGEPAEPLDLQQLGHALELGEVLLDDRVRQVGQDFRLKLGYSRSKLTHAGSFEQLFGFYKGV